MTAQYKTPKDAKEAINLVADGVNKATEETKAAVDTMMNNTVKAAEEGKAILASNQKLWQDSFETWQKYTQTYLDFVFEATQRTVEQTFAFQERLNGLAVDALKRGQALSVERQEIAFEAAQAMQAQVQATSERVAETLRTSRLTNPA